MPLGEKLSCFNRLNWMKRIKEKKTAPTAFVKSHSKKFVKWLKAKKMETNWVGKNTVKTFQLYYNIIKLMHQFKLSYVAFKIDYYIIGKDYMGWNKHLNFLLFFPRDESIMDNPRHHHHPPLLETMDALRSSCRQRLQHPAAGRKIFYSVSY